MRFEVRFDRVGVAVALLLAHVLLLFGLVTIGRKPAALPAPLLVATFITTTSEVKKWQPPTVQATTSDVPLLAPVTPSIETPVAVTAAPEGISASAESAEPPAAPGPVEQAPKMVESVQYSREPVIRYPLQSRRLREQGVVLMRVLVDERGTPAQVEIERSSGYTRLDEAGREAVLRSRFRPYTEDGVPRSVVILVPLRFTLKRR